MIIPLNFNTLSKTDQIDLLQLEGDFISSKQEGDRVVDRYQLNDFYVDVFYNAETEELISIRSHYPKRQQPIYQMPLPRLYIRQGA